MGKKAKKKLDINVIAADAFARYDNDNSGSISKNECRKMLNDACMDFDIKIISDEQFDIICAKIDVNGDGEFDIDELKLILKPLLLQANEVKQANKDDKKFFAQRRQLFLDLKEKYNGLYIKDLAKI
jgi:hypothetical protein